MVVPIHSKNTVSHVTMSKEQSLLEADNAAGRNNHRCNRIASQWARFFSLTDNATVTDHNVRFLSIIVKMRVVGNTGAYSIGTNVCFANAKHGALFLLQSRCRGVPNIVQLIE